MARVKRLEVWLIPGKPWLSAPAAVGLGPVPLRTGGPDGSRSGHKGSHGSKATYMYPPEENASTLKNKILNVQTQSMYDGCLVSLYTGSCTWNTTPNIVNTKHPFNEATRGLLVNGDDVVGMSGWLTVISHPHYITLPSSLHHTPILTTSHSHPHYITLPSHYTIQSQSSHHHHITHPSSHITSHSNILN